MEEDVLRPKVEREESEPEPTVVLSIPFIGVELRKVGNDLVVYHDGAEQTRMDVGPLAQRLKASLVDAVLANAKGPFAAIMRGFNSGKRRSSSTKRNRSEPPRSQKEPSDP
jgi:hypothetical protein